MQRGEDRPLAQAPPPPKSDQSNVTPLDQSNPCSVVSFEQSQFTVCTTDPEQHRISLHLKDADGKPWQEMKRFAVAEKPIFAMNAGMYHDDLSPVGLHIENGQELAPLNSNGGSGNFFMQPNGVFGVGVDSKPFVISSEVYSRSKPDVSLATQSGPMLVIDSAIHPRFEPDGTSRNIRNGVGIDDEGRAIFVISKTQVSFGKFARLFRDGLKCRNALYFDGVVSAFAQSDSLVQGGDYPTGPIVAVSDATTPASQ
ncbi:MAG: phosphodiester glycosidase family protein [Rhizobiaceae bacterium]